MRLYIGGCFQGKTDYVQNLWKQEYPQKDIQMMEGAEIHLPLSGNIDILNHYHLLVKRLLEQGEDVCGAAEKLLKDYPDLWVICDEVGMGIVPTNAMERRYREAVGRCLCVLAKEAQQVERIVCGRGMRIK